MHDAQDETSLGEEMPAEWSFRPWLLAALGLATGFGSHLILGPGWNFVLSDSRAAALAALTVFAGVLGFTLEKRLWWAALAFAAITGALAGAVTYGNGAPDHWSPAESWRMVSLALAIAVAAPLFQAARDQARLRFPYRAVHDHAWTNVVLWCGCWAFVGIVFALVVLLSALFALIKIDLLKELLDKPWFCRALCGLAFGAGLGLLRERDAVVRMAQRAVATVLAVLAPVMAVGLALFLLALPFTGLDALWDATRAATPLLLSCVVGALILANAVIGDAPEQEPRSPVLRWGATLLALVVLPLSVLAAVATGLRVGQYGLTPERLWAVTFVGIAVIYGLAYWSALVRGRVAWAAEARPANLVLAFVVCGVALLLATPFVSFNAMATRDQLARLESGRVSPEQFDWAALAFDFGDPGKAALGRLAASPDSKIRALAARTRKAETRWGAQMAARQGEALATFGRFVRVLPKGAGVPSALRETVVGASGCARDAPCTLVMLPGGNEAIVLRDDCLIAAKAPFCLPTEPLRREGDKWVEPNSGRFEPTSGDASQRRARADAYRAGNIEIRKVERRQVFIGGKPVGAAFE